MIRKELISDLGQGSVVCNLGMSNEKHYFDLGMDKFAITIRSWKWTALYFQSGFSNKFPTELWADVGKNLTDSTVLGCRGPIHGKILVLLRL